MKIHAPGLSMLATSISAGIYTFRTKSRIVCLAVLLKMKFLHTVLKMAA